MTWAVETGYCLDMKCRDGEKMGCGCRNDWTWAIVVDVAREMVYICTNWVCGGGIAY